MPISAQLLSDEPARGRRKVVYTLTDGDRVYGPFVEHTAEDPTTYVNTRAAAFTLPVDYAAVLQSIISGSVGLDAWDKTREELCNLGVKAMILENGVRVPITWPAPTNPEDVRAELAARVDAALEQGTLDSIASSLVYQLGLTKVTFERASDVVL